MIDSNTGPPASRDGAMLSHEYVADTTQHSTPGMSANLDCNSPITADSFLPPQISCPRAWQRVAIPTAPWQSSGDRAKDRENERDTRVICRLSATRGGIQGRSRNVMGGRILSRHEGAATTTNNTNTKPPTFDEERLKWVPRKRHNSRWPIEPKKEGTRMVADLQPLIDFEVPASPEPVEASLKMDEKQMRRRSTRRLSRRTSLIPGEDSPRKLPMITLSPAKNSAPAPSPVKRPPVSLSPTKVADSPHRAFRVNATPTKVVLESPKISPPEKSPAKPCSSPITPVEDSTLTPAARDPTTPAHSPASPVPLVFDQPVPDAQAEPQHEARRRLSLQSARRSERGSSGALRLLALKKSGRNSPSRRHSFTSLEDLPADAPGGSKSRRNTMDVFCVGPDELRGVAGGDKGADAALDPHKAEEVVEIDMKTSLDIFGQPTMADEPGPRRPSNGKQGDSEAKPTFEPESPFTPSADVATANDGLATSDVILSSPSGVFATTHMGGQTDMEHDFILEPTPHTSEELISFVEAAESEVMFMPQDPEGLSTIYEESSYVDNPASEEIGVKQPAQAPTPEASPPSCMDQEESSEGESVNVLSTTGETSTAQLDQSPASPELDTNMAVEGIEVSAEKQPADESVPKPHVSASHVSSAADGMASPDSPYHGQKATTTETSQDTPSVEGIQNERLLTGSKYDSSLPDSDITEVLSSPSRAERVTPPVPGTPTTVPAAGLMERIVTPDTSAAAVAAQQESSGFTPINGRQISPPTAPPGLRDEEEPEADQELDELDADEVIEEEIPADEGDEATVAIDEDMTVEAPRPQYDTLQLHARHDDSETEMLRNFVTRVTADKNAKAAAAAAALAKKIARRSGSIGSITSSTGSPMAKPGPETPASRMPLGVRSPNSPAKKRKADHLEDDLAKDNSSSHDPADQPDGPRLKRRRKRADPVLDNNNTTPLETATPSPEPDSHPTDSSAPGPRRSTRARSTRVALRPTAPSANAIAFSMIPVRLPGMGAMDEAAMDAHIAAMARQRSAEKDLAAVTRGNTRKNKGGAVPPQMVLAKQAEDPGWRMRELKGVFEARERRENGEGHGEGGGEKGGKKKGGKGVRWAEELVRFQESGEVSVFRGMARELLADVMLDHDDGVDEIAEAEPPVPAEPVVEKTARVAARKVGGATAAAVAAPAAPVSTRRTRSSRLPPPTPIKKLGNPEKATTEKIAAEKAAAEKPAAAAAPSLRTRARSLPKRTSTAAAPSPAAAPSTSTSTSSKTGMATRRTRVTKLGMSGNGTPAPKRRGRAAGAV
ncbi:hypothetical protein C8A01DRAFT_19427 [Parachaetomium inaequale]|uniref:Uncharacterized protein n=1 Tax=Parachaetomium inaequale TaxID=2588326 RepID=A0AAN6PA70_9PEZI|nr:hypothetical protein C8A01DRAFT_19427 [Parachaetomium inaequale]